MFYPCTVSVCFNAPILPLSTSLISFLPIAPYVYFLPSYDSTPMPMMISDAFSVRHGVGVACGGSGLC
ncbi:hypothetical protein HETIRDRAFT_330712 [Heterobasidion irregulare TC 32-1]|uniref:Uncharacterized protein n=1 Tax=Heterobasidion irregulare (strain TC 32-1) TaxID=747525 RepID=W4JNK2_HETIT|nr:uncharacterized protein HETIRDRAFT_330712 [Heterobasidion irregulare TC 32-1]ETW75137.1 hypothetical protein HETIRDRAFT_330712 [Heterobasidion irregulare TC 32-1]